MKTLILIVIFLINIANFFGQNLVLNPSFETEGNVNCESWYNTYDEELSIHCDSITNEIIYDNIITEDAPPGGGDWSLGIVGRGHAPANYVNSYITGQHGTSIYECNLWIKNASDIPGGIQIFKRSQGKEVLINYIQAKDTPEWFHYSVTDTISLQTTDSIRIELRAMGVGLWEGIVYFDKIEFGISGTLTPVKRFNIKKKMVNVYPNPSDKLITFKFENNDYKILTIYDITGQQVMSIETMKEKFTIDDDNITTGIYLYQVRSKVNDRIIGQGRFVIK